ncbi:hypothetical protein A3Q56_00257 [Intoshia linei]|uniref:SWIM-type domain-containing protein n=1 Tax=Intoshia linei TaxID=1819745 RepID=A0A177BCQ9_9BILA|nr:hypothetical protein A3Q56_00257 [Intoshia linei]
MGLKSKINIDMDTETLMFNKDDDMKWDNEIIKLNPINKDKIKNRELRYSLIKRYSLPLEVIQNISSNSLNYYKNSVDMTSTPSYKSNVWVETPYGDKANAADVNNSENDVDSASIPIKQLSLSNSPEPDFIGCIGDSLNINTKNYRRYESSILDNIGEESEGKSKSDTNRFSQDGIYISSENELSGEFDLTKNENEKSIQKDLTILNAPRNIPESESEKSSFNQSKILIEVTNELEKDHKSGNSNNSDNDKKKSDIEKSDLSVTINQSNSSNPYTIQDEIHLSVAEESDIIVETRHGDGDKTDRLSNENTNPTDDYTTSIKISENIIVTDVSSQDQQISESTKSLSIPIESGDSRENSIIESFKKDTTNNDSTKLSISSDKVTNTVTKAVESNNDQENASKISNPSDVNYNSRTSISRKIFHFEGNIEILETNENIFDGCMEKMFEEYEVCYNNQEWKLSTCTCRFFLKNFKCKNLILVAMHLNLLKNDDLLVKSKSIFIGEKKEDVPKEPQGL